MVDPSPIVSTSRTTCAPVGCHSGGHHLGREMILLTAITVYIYTGEDGQKAGKVEDHPRHEATRALISHSPGCSSRSWPCAPAQYGVCVGRRVSLVMCT